MQHTHPLGSSIRSDKEELSVPSLAIMVSTESDEDTPLLPMLPSPNSFSMTAIRRLCCLDVSMFLRRVVLPEPRKPVRMVTGTAEEGLSMSSRVGMSSSLSESDIVVCGERKRFLPSENCF